VIHSNDPTTVMDYAAAVQVLRVTVNEGGSTGSAGFGTHLAPSMTIGTGFVGRSSLGENLQPKHLVNVTRVAYSTDPSEVLPAYEGTDPWRAPKGPVPPYPAASNLAPYAVGVHGSQSAAPTEEVSELREELRRLILEELTTIIRG
jgi:acetaldehyde dehydrogenase / alcohol dehydrogenase